MSHHSEIWEILTLVTCGDLNVDLSENKYRSSFLMVFRELSNAISVFLYVAQEPS